MRVPLPTVLREWSRLGLIGFGGLPGALVGGLGFILPGLLMVLAIAALALGEAPPAWILGIGAGAGAAVVAVVAHAGYGLGRSSLGGRRDVRPPLYLAARF